MKQLLCLLMAVLCLIFCACGDTAPQPEPERTAPSETTPETAETTAAPTQTTLPPHSELYIPGLSVEDVILYFNEVVLDAEYNTGTGDPALVQKWTEPIIYRVEGPATQEDLTVLEGFAERLNSIEGFPGIYPTNGDTYESLYIYFCDEHELMYRLGNHLAGSDGAVTFWYTDNVIYEATICYRKDIDQHTRNSVILEEIYNGLGPVQDTELRTDSIIYSGFSEPQALTQIDELILRLLYHPSIRPGMTASECEQIIRQLYY